MTRLSFFLLLGLVAPALAQPIQLPAETTLTLQLPANTPLRPGQPIRAILRYPVYSGTTLVLPQDTVVTGTITALRPDPARRLRSRFNLDFTPFRIPTVQFDHILLPTGEPLPITTTPTSAGAVIVHLAAHPQQPQNFLHRQFTATVHLVRDTALFFVAPGRGDRILQLTYHQLPWHPQRIERGTVWTVETAHPLQLPSTPIQPATVSGSRFEATLDQPLSSATAHAGQSIRANLAQPALDPATHATLPAGTVLLGTVTQAEPSRSFNRSGALHLEFRQLQLPSGAIQPIQSRLVAADAPAAQHLALDAEGGLSPQPTDKVIVPAILVALAVAPLTPDPGDNDEFFKNAGASNSLGAAGFITGVAANNANLSAAFGFYGASLSIASRWLAHGTDITFPRGTRIVLELTPTRSPAQKLPANSAGH